MLAAIRIGWIYGCCDRPACDRHSRNGRQCSDTSATIDDWLHESLAWVETDYQQRSVDEILERRAGNCAEQAKVLDALLRAAGVSTRWIAEINIHPPSNQRQADSESLITEYGSQATVFGYRHNDHRWLEIHDLDSNDWIPADATLGIVGLDDWIDARLDFGPHPEAATEMLVPFCVIVLDLDRVLHKNRTEHYLVDAFSRHYGAGLAELESWNDWTTQVLRIGDLGARTFGRSYDLHNEQERIEDLVVTYARLASQARRTGLETTC